jgi:hypothetical protein
VPFLVGMQHKTEDVRALVGGLVRVNVGKDKVGEGIRAVATGSRGSQCALQIAPAEALS